MKKIVILLILILTFTTGRGWAQLPDYVLGPGDVLAISVWGYEDLKSDGLNGLSIRPDGKIAFPIAGDISVAGLTPAEAADKIASVLATYITEPKVTVNVLNFRTTRVYVLGEVAKPGMYELIKRNNLLDAIGAAGGYTKDAAKKKVFIIREGNKKNKPIQVDLLKLLREGDMTQNYVLGEGDVVFLSGNYRLDFGRDILPFITAYRYIGEIEHKDY